MFDVRYAAALSIVVIATACSKPYDFSGAYVLTKGDECQNLPGENNKLTVLPSPEGASFYSVVLSPQMVAGSGFPLESKPAKVSEDGTITFTFLREGQTGLFSGTPTVDMKIKLVEKDSEHVYIASWPVTLSSAGSSAKIATFNLVKDAEFSVGSLKFPNSMRLNTGRNGLCLKRERV